MNWHNYGITPEPECPDPPELPAGWICVVTWDYLPTPFVVTNTYTLAEQEKKR